MNNLFKNFDNSNAKYTSTNFSINASVEIHGSIDIIKGGLTEDVSFYAKVGESMHKGHLTIEDWDINDRLGASFNGMPVDDLCKLKSTLKSSGLATLADTLEMDYNKQRDQICIQLLKDDLIKKVFGEGLNFTELLSKTEKDILNLTWVIKHYKNTTANSYQIREFCDEDDLGNRIMPALKELKALLKQLKA